MLEVEFLTLDPKSFENIQDFFTKFKDLLSQLKAHMVDKYKEEKQMVLTILSKLGLGLSVFISTFHSFKLSSRATYKMPSLEEFIESLTQEQTELINMGKIKGPKAHALTVKDGSDHQYQKSKDKDKRKAHENPKKEGYSKPFTNASRSKGGKGRKGDKCTYCHKGFHPESTCMQKQIDLMTQILHQNNLGDHILEGNSRGEYVNHENHNLCHEVGIQLHHTVPYTPQQNRVVEWKNRSLKEMASCMLHAKSLPLILWVEALNCETYIQNKSPHRSVKDNTPYEAWSSLKPKVTHFRIFNSRAWAQIPSKTRKAPDTKRT
jgi:hypothetical protein